MEKKRGRMRFVASSDPLREHPGTSWKSLAGSVWDKAPTKNSNMPESWWTLIPVTGSQRKSFWA